MLQIREAHAEDAALISQMITASWRGAYQHIIDPAYLARLPEEFWLPTMRAWLASGRMYGLIACENGHPRGCIIFGRGRDENHADWGEIVSLYVLPEKMGRGVGSRLLTEALDALHEDGYNKVYLWAFRHDARAGRFYLRHGFIPIGDTVDYRLGNQKVADLRYVKEIR